MWIPGSLAYVIAALWIFAEWLRESERRSIAIQRSRIKLVTPAAILVAGLVSLASCDRASGDQSEVLVDASPNRGRAAIAKYGDKIAVGLDVRGTTLAARGWTAEGGDLYETLARLDHKGNAIEQLL